MKNFFLFSFSLSDHILDLTFVYLLNLKWYLIFEHMDPIPYKSLIFSQEHWVTPKHEPNIAVSSSSLWACIWYKIIRTSKFGPDGHFLNYTLVFKLYKATLV